MELSILFFGVFLRAVHIGLLKRLSFSRMNDECDGQGVLMRVSDAMVKEWFDFGISWLIDRIHVNSILAFVAVAYLCKGDWDALGSHDRFSYEYKTGKLCCVIWSAPMVFKLSDSSEAIDAGTDSSRPIYCEEFAKRGVSSNFAIVAWLQ